MTAEMKQLSTHSSYVALFRLLRCLEAPENGQVFITSKQQAIFPFCTETHTVNMYTKEVKELAPVHTVHLIKQVHGGALFKVSL